MSSIVRLSEWKSKAPNTEGVPEEFLNFLDIPLEIIIELGRTQLRIRDIIALEKDSIISLPQSAGEELGVYVNNICIGRGIVVVMDDRTGIRVTEMINNGLGDGNE